MAGPRLDEREIFNAARRLASPEARAEYLRQACGDDQHFRDRIVALLHGFENGDGFLEPPPAAVVSTLDLPPLAELPSVTIGRYGLLRKIGEGGMGVVYLAEQREPVRRQVALKIIRPGMDTREVIARFEAERQALALMDHPNVAHVLDAGATESGSPYFVMELVLGVPITQFCDDNKLTTGERLELFVQVCQAVQHAHLKGIIHRDLKPSNVLVTSRDGVPVPKIIDFGVAKATNQQLTDRSAITSLGQIVGTPLYMSPEQVDLSCLDVDTRSDIYSLGVLLYELLTGTTPFDRDRLRKAGIDAMRRAIREEEPLRPSTRISTLGQAATTVSIRRKTDPARLSRVLRGELDWIVMKALEKDRARRYQTAHGFARDIQRFLADEPIEARPPTPADRAARWARRHRPLVWSAAILFLLGTLGSLVSTLLIAREHGKAVRAYEKQALQLAATERAEELARKQEQVARRQERLAKEQERLAEEQQKLAMLQKEEAVRQRDAAEHALYVANMRLARADWMSGETGRLGSLLDSQFPKSGRPDLRGWEWFYLFSNCHGERLMLPWQNFFRWSPTGEYLATADLIGRINIWDAATGRRKASLKDCPPRILAISWSPNAEYLAVALDRGTVAIWEVASATKLKSLTGHGAAMRSIDWSPDGERLAAGEGEGANFVWDAKREETLSVQQEIGEATIWIWDWQNAKTLASLVVPAGPISTLDWHPDGRRLLAVSGSEISQELSIFDVGSQQVTSTRPMGWGSFAAFCPDGDRLVLGTDPVRVIELKTGEVVASLPYGEASHPSWSPSGNRLAAVCPGGAIKTWDPASGSGLASIAVFTPAMQNVDWSPQGELLAASHGEGQFVGVWDTAATARAVTFPMSDKNALAVAFSPDGKRLLAGSQNGQLRIYDLESHEVTLSVVHGASWIRCVAWSPEGTRFACRVGEDVLICDASTGAGVVPRLQCGDEARSLAFSPDGKILAVGLRRIPSPPMRGRVKLFSASTGEELAASPYAEGPCDSIAWSPDGGWLAAGGDSLRVWDANLRPRPFHVSGQSVAVDWSSDGCWLAAGGPNVVTIYEAETGEPVRTLRGYPGIAAIRWHPSGSRLATVGRDRMVRIWDRATGQEVFSLEAHAELIQDVDWSPDGLRLATASWDGTVRIWDASPADRFFKRHGDLRAQIRDLVGGYWARVDKGAMREEFQQALDLLEQLRTLHPEEPELDSQIQYVNWFRATQLARAGRTDEAIAVFQQLTANSPDLPDWRLQLPRGLLDAGKEAEAIETLEKAVAEFAQQPEYREELAFLYERRAIRLCASGQVEQAIPVLRRLTSEFPERPGHRSQLVRQLTAQASSEQALETFRKLVLEFPDAPEYSQAVDRLLKQDPTSR